MKNFLKSFFAGELSPEERALRAATAPPRDVIRIPGATDTAEERKKAGGCCGGGCGCR